MMSRQFQVMLDVLTNLLFARLPKPRRSSLLKSAEDDDDGFKPFGEYKGDEMVTEGDETVDLTGDSSDLRKLIRVDSGGGGGSGAVGGVGEEADSALQFYAAICTHSPTKPVLIFVSSRRQTRLTTLYLIQVYSFR
ncbi:putative DNA helicase [Helianthus anomalus]